MQCCALSPRPGNDCGPTVPSFVTYGTVAFRRTLLRCFPTNAARTMPLFLRPFFHVVPLGLAALLVVIDQSTKLWAVATLVSPGNTLPLPGPVDLTLFLNRSTAFGIAPIAGEFSRWGLTLFSVAVAVGLCVAIVQGNRRSTAFAYAFIIAGAIGNAVDRIRIGAVIDFIDASEIRFPWVFNVADVWIDVGVGLLILSWMLARSEDHRLRPGHLDGN